MWKVAVIEGDGIGPEVISATVNVINAINDIYKLPIELEFLEAGLGAYKKYGTNLPKQSMDKLFDSDCALKGPTTSLEGFGTELGVPVKIRKMFNLYANIRPFKPLPRSSSLAKLDVLIVRENTEGSYSGLEYRVSDQVAFGIRITTRSAAEKIFKVAFSMAEKRKKKVTLAHKANVLKATDGLYKEVFLNEARRHPEVLAEDAHVDALAHWLILKPEFYDVIVAENLYGDIISDEAAALVGGLGLAASANLGDKYAMFEPVHGSAPDIAGKGISNPVAAMLSFKMMLEWMGYPEVAWALESAINQTLTEGEKLTPDMGGSGKTEDIEKKVISNLQKNLHNIG
ncbi:MAG: isocitrate/isopropylmalate dehydrogenase family protein [Conexivisphaerales archaeon]